MRSSKFHYAIFFFLKVQMHKITLVLFSLKLAMGKMMEQGPVLIITFQAQLVMVIRNMKGEVVEGDPVSQRSHDKRLLAISVVKCRVEV